jgi:hypothetical protein
MRFRLSCLEEIGTTHNSSSDSQGLLQHKEGVESYGMNVSQMINAKWAALSEEQKSPFFEAYMIELQIYHELLR